MLVPREVAVQPAAGAAELFVRRLERVMVPAVDAACSPKIAVTENAGGVHYRLPRIAPVMTGLGLAGSGAFLLAGQVATLQWLFASGSHPGIDSEFRLVVGAILLVFFLAGL